MAKSGMISVLVVSAVVAACGISADAAAHDPPPNFKVAFFGDSKMRSDQPELFQMLNHEQVGMIVHAGDLSYSRNQNLIFQAVESTMGPNFPFVAALGNHDLDGYALSKWYSGTWVEGYQLRLREQAASAGVQCYEDPRGGAGAMQACSYQGVLVVNVSYKLLVDWFKNLDANDYAEFIDNAFRAAPNVRWRICNFHMPIKGDSDLVVETCKKWGAIIANGHRHSYLRTHYAGLAAAQNQFDGDLNVYELGPGQSIQWVSGLGGETPEVVRKKDYGPATVVVWPQRTPVEAASGAVICEFNPGGEAPDVAVCSFRDVLGRNLDVFTLRSLAPVEWDQAYTEADQ